MNPFELYLLHFCHMDFFGSFCMWQEVSIPSVYIFIQTGFTPAIPVHKHKQAERCTELPNTHLGIITLNFEGAYYPTLFYHYSKHMCAAVLGDWAANEGLLRKQTSIKRQIGGEWLKVEDRDIMSTLLGEEDCHILKNSFPSLFYSFCCAWMNCHICLMCRNSQTAHFDNLSEGQVWWCCPGRLRPSPWKH